MKKCYADVIEINQMPDDDQKEARARGFFENLNTMTLTPLILTGPQRSLKASTWLPIRIRLPWSTKISTPKKASLSPTASWPARPISLVNFLADQGIGHKSNMYMMVPICPEIWFASLACIKAGIVAVPTATSMTSRELEYRFETYKPDVIMADEASVDLLEQAIEETGISPKVKLILGEREGWTSFSAIESADKEAEAAPKPLRMRSSFAFLPPVPQGCPSGWATPPCPIPWATCPPP